MSGVKGKVRKVLRLEAKMLRIGKKVLKNGLHNDERTVARLTKAQHRYQAGLLSLSDTQRARFLKAEYKDAGIKGMGKRKMKIV